MWFFFFSALLGGGGVAARLAANSTKVESREFLVLSSKGLFVALGGWFVFNSVAVIPSATSAATSTLGVVHAESIKSTGLVLKFPWQRLEEVSLAPMVIIRNKANQNPASTLVAGNRLEVDAQCSALVNGKRVGELLARRIDYEQVVHTACGNALRKAGVLLTDNGDPVVPAKGQEASSQLTLEEALGPKRWLLERNATRAFSRSLREQLASVGVSPDAIGGALIQIRDTEVDPEVAKAIADRQTLAEQVKGSESLLAIARNKAAAAGTGNASAVRKYLADLRGVTPEAVGSISTDEALRVQHALNAAKLVESGNVGWGVAGIEGLSVSPPKR